MAFDFGKALGGAASGASVGSSFGPIGGAVGGLFGGLAGGLFGGKRKPKKRSTMDPKQQAIYNQYIQALLGKGGPFGQDLSFNPQQVQDVYQQNFAQPAYQQFQEEILPGITGAFRGQNLQNSSYLGEALGRAGTNVQKDLNAKLMSMLYNAQQSSIDRRLNAVNNIMGQTTFDYEKPQPNGLDSILGGLTEHAGKFLANKYMPIPQS